MPGNVANYKGDGFFSLTTIASLINVHLDLEMDVITIVSS